MPIDLVLIAVDRVVVDIARFPDSDMGFVPEHLLHYCAKLEELPAITVRVEGDRAILVRGHEYLAIAKNLGRSRIRAVVDPGSSRHDVERFLRGKDVEVLDWEKMRSEEESTPVISAWHVIYFCDSLSLEQKCVFNELVAAVVEPEAHTCPVQHDDSGPLVEFKIATPLDDRRWINDFLHRLSEFNARYVPIASYQGRRYGQPDGAT